MGEGAPAFPALVERPVQAERRVLAGMRAPDPPERAFVEERRIRSISRGSLIGGPAELLRSLRGTGLGRAYLHLDVCDPREVPTVACPTPGGLRVSALVQTLEAISSEVEVVGAGITEALLEGRSISLELQPILD